MSLPNIVQNICYDQRSASLVLRRQIEEGIIFFAGGEIVHAKMGSMEGADAVYQMLRWTDGTFRISEKINTSARTVNVPWNHLLMEGMRLLDEQEAGNTMQVDEELLTPTQIRCDETLEGDLFVLLSRLEQMQDQLSHRKIKKNPPLALKILTEIINEVVTFSEVWLDTTKYPDSLTRVLATTGDIYSAAQMLQVQNNKLSIDVVLKLYTNWGKDSTRRRQMFNQIGQAMLDILETYFSLLLTGFYSPSAAELCQEVSDVFLVDLTQTMDSIKF